MGGLSACWLVLLPGFSGGHVLHQTVLHILSPDFMAMGLQVGKRCRSSAAAPAMCGELMEVPAGKRVFDLCYNKLFGMVISSFAFRLIQVQQCVASSWRCLQASTSLKCVSNMLQTCWLEWYRQASNSQAQTHSADREYGCTIPAECLKYCSIYHSNT
jgi:hypothetical protein